MGIRRIKRKITDRLGITAVQHAASLSLGKSSAIDPRVEIHAGHIEIGDYSYIGGPGRISSLPETRISIGKFTSIAAGVQIIGAMHKSHITNYSLPRLLPKGSATPDLHGVSKGDISIGSDVWIGANAIILSGVTIGHGAVIGAGAVVNKDVPPYAVCVGVPATVKKKRFKDADVAALLGEQWWNWQIEQILSAVEEFYDDSISPSEFLARHHADHRE